MIYELTRQFKIELCRPFGACIVGDYGAAPDCIGINFRPHLLVDSLLRRVLPYANLCRPVGACIVSDSLLRRVSFLPQARRLRPQ